MSAATDDPDLRWEAFAAREPYFAVLTAPRFLRANLTPDSEREFFASGEQYVDWLLRLIQNSRITSLLMSWLPGTKKNGTLRGFSSASNSAHSFFNLARVRRIARNEIAYAHHEFGHDQVKLVYRIEKNAWPHAAGAIAHDRKLEVFRIVVEIQVGPRFQLGIDVALKLRGLRLRDNGGNEADGAYHPQRGNTPTAFAFRCHFRASNWIATTSLRLSSQRQIEIEDFILVVFATDFARRDFQPIAKNGSRTDFTAGIGHEELRRMNE